MEIGDRMKMYESSETGRRLVPMLPVCIRVDGKGFHSLTRRLGRPFDSVFIKMMQSVALFLAEQTQAKVAYTQSDEISLILFSDDVKSQIFFDGKIFKITSVIASMATFKFAEERQHADCDLFDIPALFDCRVWNVPNLVEAANTLIWRELDASRNSVQMAARSVYSHKQCKDKCNSELQEMLHSKGINWNDYPSFFKRGTYFRRRKVLKALTQLERERIPEQHRPPEGHLVERTEYVEGSLVPLTKIKNRVRYLFHGEDPEVGS